MSAVVVVGAGIVGASVAYHLARRGVPVTLIERGPAPAADVTGDSFAWISGAGGDRPGGARELREYVLADHSRLEAELPDVTVRRTGSLTWDADDAVPGAAPRLAPGRFRVGRSDIAALEPHLQNPPEQAIHTPGDVGVDPTALTRALVTAAGAYGATVLHDTAVTALHLSGTRVRGVVSSAGHHTAATVVLAAGTDVPRLCAPVAPGLAVTSSPATLVRVGAPPGLVKSIVATPEFEVREVRDGELWMPLAQGLGGGGTIGSESAARDALHRLRTFFRGAEECRLLSCRTRGRPVPPHGPVIGHVTPDRSVYVAVMHSAVTLAPTVGRLVAEELVTGAPVRELRRCRPAVGDV
ncbi:NAD(P)/FAD-dependent oxidoreductase [Streptomyces sp. NPDC016845]|uniref:NAD(P)/FAD-dependent oxidoreductase n=1 Tax=Streptomyces sp. NPDC016845 TaxID=3364972 RepID=UPI0037AAB7F2